MLKDEATDDGQLVFSLGHCSFSESELGDMHSLGGMVLAVPLVAKELQDKDMFSIWSFYYLSCGVDRNEVYSCL